MPNSLVKTLNMTNSRYLAVCASTKFFQSIHECIFLGFAPGQKGYKLYELESQKAIVSRDVVFDDSFQYKNKSHDGIVELRLSDKLGHSEPKEIIETIVQRKSTRERHTPFWMKDYVSQVSMDDHFGFLSKITQAKEPKGYEEAALDPRWVEAMQQELKASETNDTWQLVALPPGKKALASKWVYKIKYLLNGDVERYKARLVAKGYNQKIGIDYCESFSPMAKTATVRLLLAIGATRQWQVHQININNAYLHGYIDEDIYL